MKTFSNSTDKNDIVKRLHNLAADSQRRWGKMTAHQMVCHLTDSFKGAMNEKSVNPIDTIISRTIVKWVALQVPITWPKGFKTLPEMDQEIGGTKPVEFEKDVVELEMIVDRFSQLQRDFEWQPHPVFGRMSDSEWRRWGYLHTDHHLRQFGL